MPIYKFNFTTNEDFILYYTIFILFFIPFYGVKKSDANEKSFLNPAFNILSRTSKVEAKTISFKNKTTKFNDYGVIGHSKTLNKKGFKLIKKKSI